MYISTHDMITLMQVIVGGALVAVCAGIGASTAYGAWKKRKGRK